MVFFNLVLFGAILCCDESFSSLNKLLKWLCVSQKSSGKPWRYDAQTSFQKDQKELTDRSTVNTQLPGPGAFRLSQSQQEPGLHVSNTMFCPGKWQWKRTLTWRQNRTPTKAAFPKKLPQRSVEMFWAALLCEAHPTQSSGFPFSLWPQPEIHHSWKAFIGCSCPLCLFMLCGFFFPIHFLGVWFCYAILMASAFQKN